MVVDIPFVEPFLNTFDTIVGQRTAVVRQCVPPSAPIDGFFPGNNTPIMKVTRKAPRETVTNNTAPLVSDNFRTF